MKTVSFRQQLKGTISDFLTDEGMHCPNTEEGLLEVVVALSNYTEEGRPLFPQMVICDDLSTTLALLQCSDALRIGSGPRNEFTMLKALKQCASLANEGWAVFMQRSGSSIEYGVFRLPSSPTALDIRDTMQDIIGEEEVPNIILATQTADKAIELIGSRSGILNVYLSARRDDSPSPRQAINDLVEACCIDVDNGIADQVQSYLRTTLSIGIHHCHGTLIAVLPLGNDPKSIMSDGVFFQSSISLSSLVSQYETRPNNLNSSTLLAYRNLFIGMLNCDGIVMIDTQCQLIGFNIFVHIDEPSKAKTPKSEQMGGARHRAFATLRSLIDSGQLRASFICSSDGSSETYKR